MLQTQYAYGQWPASVEIDIVESRGNRNYQSSGGTHKGVDSFGSTLHYGPSYAYNRWYTAHVSKFFFDGVETLDVSPPSNGGFWKYGNLDQTGVENPWRSGNGRAVPNCQSYPCLIFEDNFDTLDLETWEHEITASGGGNWEFEYYLNNRSNSYVRDGVLYIKPTLTTDRFGPDSLTKGSLDLWGGTPGDTCTSAAFYGCKRDGTGTHPINPIQSARLRSSRGFSFKYGKIEVEAKMPAGDWIWPAIWMLPLRNAYGQWPASGEIDIVESRGNRHYTAPDGTHKGVDSFGSTLHFGPSILDKSYDPWQTAHVEKTLSQGTLADDFHKYGVEWTEDHIKFLFDGQETLTVAPPAQGGFWKHGNLDKTGFENPYRNTSKIAPFDQKFYLIMNVAVGGVGYFDDTLSNSPTPKPWHDHSDFTTRDFLNAKNQWYPTWNPTERNGEDAAMKVNYIKVWKLSP
ncbi:Beta-1,3-glucan-binding protein [Mizuhopecten yessoensis]|uniref:Beta-1,3-glucan-binding protein n=1 Tax=Mizuhopecten yessoensis TaxID=6573 RepID=A0A210QCR3_MIZYE|nr:Beta-1,3-glucan-binding protein [Mizuhopecten yessoensis]